MNEILIGSPEIYKAISELVLGMIITVGASILSSVLKKPEKEPRASAQEKYFQSRVDAGKELAKRKKMVANAAAAMTGRPASDFYGNKEYHRKMNKLFDETLDYGAAYAGSIYQGKEKEITPRGMSPEVQLNTGYPEGEGPYTKGEVPNIDLTKLHSYAYSPENIADREINMTKEAESLGLGLNEYIKLREKEKDKSYLDIVKEYKTDASSHLGALSSIKWNKNPAGINIYLGEYGGNK